MREQFISQGYGGELTGITIKIGIWDGVVVKALRY